MGVLNGDRPNGVVGIDAFMRSLEDRVALVFQLDFTLRRVGKDEFSQNELEYFTRVMENGSPDDVQLVATLINERGRAKKDE